MSAKSRDIRQKILAKKGSHPIAWRFVRTGRPDTYISYPSWWKHATDADLKEAYERLSQQDTIA